VIDCYSKYSWGFALKKKTAEEVLSCFKKICHLEGPPAILHTDNGAEFANGLLESFCEEMNILVIHGRPRHPQSQGQIERFNQTVSRKLSKSLYGDKEKAWSLILDDMVYAYNLAIHRATKRTPFCLFRNRDGYNAYKVRY